MIPFYCQNKVHLQWNKKEGEGLNKRTGRRFKITMTKYAITVTEKKKDIDIVVKLENILLSLF